MSGRAGWGRRLRAGAWVAAAACVLLFARGLSWRGVLAAIGQANGSLLALAGVLALGALVVQGLRWHQVVQPVQRVPLRTVLAASLAGQAASCVLPLRAGEAVRLELLARASGMGRAAVIRTSGRRSTPG